MKTRNWYKGLTATAITVAMAGAAFSVPALAIDYDLNYGDVEIGTDAEGNVWSGQTQDGKDYFHYVESTNPTGEGSYEFVSGKYYHTNTETGAVDTEVNISQGNISKEEIVHNEGSGSASDVFEQVTENAPQSTASEGTVDSTVTVSGNLNQASGTADDDVVVNFETDIKTSKQITVAGADVTIDLNGNTLQSDSELNNYGGVMKIENSNVVIESTAVDDTGEVVKGVITGGSSNFGGGLYIDESNVTIKHIEITENEVTRYGGGIYAASSNLYLEDVWLTNNSADSGGGLHTDTNGLENDQEYVTVVKDSVVSGNTAENVGGGLHVAGSHYLTDNTTNTLYVSDSLIENNNAVKGSGGGIHVDGNGAMLSIENEEDTTVEIANNKAGTAGGGIYVSNLGYVSVNGADIHNNEADAGGGGMYVQLALDKNQIISISNTKIHNNSSARGGGAYFTTDDGIEVDIESDKIYSELESVEIYGNEAEVGSGLYVKYWLTKLDKVQIHDNTAEYEGGGIYSNWSKIVASDSEIAANTAGPSGGGMYHYYSRLDMTGGSVSGNKANGWGGGIYSDNTLTALESVDIVGNTASRDGGGIYHIYWNDSQADIVTLKLTDTLVRGNQAAKGGGVYNEAASAVFESGAIYNNTASSAGDDIYSTGTMTLIPVADFSAALDYHYRDWYIDGYDGTKSTSRFGRQEDGSLFADTLQQLTLNGKYALKVAAVYTVTFVDEDGTELKEPTQYLPDETPIPPADPVKEADDTYTYTFAGWTPQINPVTGDITYTASYTPQEIADPIPESPYIPEYNPPEVDIDDPDVPLVEEPEEPEEPEQPTEEIDDEETPLTPSIPDEVIDDIIAEIEDEVTPLANVPQTGAEMPVATAALPAGVLALAVSAVVRRIRRKD